MRTIHKAILAASHMVLATVAAAHGVNCGDLSISHPYASPTMGNGTVGAVYFKSISNKGKVDDQLTGVRTKIAGSVEIHEMAMDKDVMKMRPVSELAVPAGGSVSLLHGQPNGHHLMLMDLSKPLKEGDKFAITLTFKRAGECKAEVWVEAPRVGVHAH